jgi:hypothetical protein
MLLVLIPIVWLALIALLAAICRVAADADGLRAPSRNRDAVSIGARLTLPLAAHVGPQARRGHRGRPAQARAMRRRRPAHTVR